jgi:sec-independent protein translocase protein TatA
MNIMFGLFNLGGGEIIVILVLILILFGAKRIPELAKGLGTGIKEFKKATREVTDEVHNAMDETPSSAPKRLPPQPTPADPQKTVSQTPPASNA